MHKYCLDTSGFSNPLVTLPEDVFPGVWAKIIDLIKSGIFCCNEEIAEQYWHVEGAVGDCLRTHIAMMVYEIGQSHWNWRGYIDNFNRMKAQYSDYISEYNGGRKNTVDVDDVSLVALAKTLGLPVVSMEGFDGGQGSMKRMRIPRLCDCEKVPHLTFNELLRVEKVRF